MAQTWLVGDLVIAIVPLFATANSSMQCLKQALHVVKGYLGYHSGSECSGRKLSSEEVQCLWPLIVLRSILLYVVVKKLTISDPTNKYLQDEVILNEKILKLVLNVPFYLANQAMLVVGAELGSSSSSSKTLQSPCSNQVKISQFVKDAENTNEVDLGVFSELYQSESAYIFDITSLILLHFVFTLF